MINPWRSLACSVLNLAFDDLEPGLSPEKLELSLSAVRFFEEGTYIFYSLVSDFEPEKVFSRYLQLRQAKELSTIVSDLQEGDYGNDC